jgi:hypothetical protein
LAHRSAVALVPDTDPSFAANIVLADASERHVVGKKYGDIPLGLNIIRGENVVLLGEIVSDI